MSSFNVAIKNCLSAMNESSDFSDNTTTTAIQELLSEIISNPKQLVNCSDEENLSLVLSSILTSSYPYLHPTWDGVNVRNLVFICGYYLYMHQLETGYFYDRNWPAFILLFHLGRHEFAKFSIEMNPFAIERVQKIMGGCIDYNRAINEAKGVELNMMLVAKRKGFLTSEIEPWFDKLYDDYDELLSNNDPFQSVAIPLYKCIANYFKENDITFVNSVK